MRAYREHSGLASVYGPAFLERMRDHGLSAVMTLESLTVSPEWRRSSGGVAIGRAVSALGLEAFRSSGADGVLISTRNSRRMNEVALQLGFESAGRTLMHGEESELMFFRAETRRRFEDPALESLVRRLWETRIDFSDLALEGKVSAA